MSDNIPQIGATEIEADKKVIAELEELLAQARSGELIGISHISFVRGHEVIYGVVGDYAKGQRQRIYFLLHWLAQQQMLSWDEQTRKTDTPRT